MAVGVTSSIVSPYKRDDTIDAAATVKNGEDVFTHSSPRSSALEDQSRATGGNRVRRPRSFSPGRVHTPAARATPRLGLKGNVQVRGCAQPCHSADVYRREGVLKWLNAAKQTFLNVGYYLSS